MNDITVPVPDDRTAEFYQFFGLWLAGSLSLSSTTAGATSEVSTTPSQPPARKAWGSSPEADATDAEALWAKYSKNARGMFSLLMDNPGKEFTGDEIAEAVGIPNGAHGVAGVLAWPGRHGAEIGRFLPTSFREDEETGLTYYRMTADQAELFKAAREKVEGSA
jgi:hypothetical protein